MNERNPLEGARKEAPFQKGGLVQLRDDMNPEVRTVLEKELDFTKSYRIYYLNHNDED